LGEERSREKGRPLLGEKYGIIEEDFISAEIE
jgi:hypothetical protein